MFARTAESSNTRTHEQSHLFGELWSSADPEKTRAHEGATTSGTGKEGYKNSGIEPKNLPNEHAEIPTEDVAIELPRTVKRSKVFIKRRRNIIISDQIPTTEAERVTRSHNQRTV